MVATRFGLSRKSGNLQTEIAGNFAPKQVETLVRNEWQLWSEIRTNTSPPIAQDDKPLNKGFAEFQAGCRQRRDRASVGNRTSLARRA
jgi:hypothetical protein